MPMLCAENKSIGGALINVSERVSRIKDSDKVGKFKVNNFQKKKPLDKSRGSKYGEWNHFM
jgi:hypothetical protein